MKIEDLEYFVESMFVVAKHQAVKAVLRDDNKFLRLMAVLKNTRVPVDKHGGLAMFIRGNARDTTSSAWFKNFRRRIANDLVTGPAYKAQKLFDPFEFIDEVEIVLIYEDIKEIISEWIRLYGVVMTYRAERELTKGFAQM